MGKRISGAGRGVASARVARRGLGDPGNIPAFRDGNPMTRDLGRFLDGQSVRLADGFSGQIRYEEYVPTSRTGIRGRASQSITVSPNERTRNSTEYRNDRARYGDDYVRDITDSDEIIQIAIRKGYYYGAGERRWLTR